MEAAVGGHLAPLYAFTKKAALLVRIAGISADSLLCYGGWFFGLGCPLAHRYCEAKLVAL